ncbi:MAG: hypothetical protein Q8P18_27860 [Pseudomonadota bacterium]|nr:hypothetical protein [Pseudomonadota bacterium]
METPTTPRAQPRWIGQLLPPLLASLTLGLAPFTPEPHIVGKVLWVAGGAHGMQAMDWGDLALHGAPWIWLAGTIVRVAMRSRRAPPR